MCVWILGPFVRARRQNKDAASVMLGCCQQPQIIPNISSRLLFVSDVCDNKSKNVI